MKNTLNNIRWTDYFWIAVPVLFSSFLVITGYVFTHRISLGLCHRIFTGGTLSTSCVDSYPYYDKVGAFLSIFSFFYIISALYVFYVKKIQFIKVWIFISTIFSALIVGNEMLNYSLNFQDLPASIYGDVLLFITAISGVIFSAQNKAKRKGPIVVGLILLIPTILFILLVLSLNSFPMMG